MSRVGTRLPHSNALVRSPGTQLRPRFVRCAQQRPIALSDVGGPAERGTVPAFHVSQFEVSEAPEALRAELAWRTAATDSDAAAVCIIISDSRRFAAARLYWWDGSEVRSGMATIRLVPRVQ